MKRHVMAATIEAIAAGYHTLSDIATMAGIPRTNIVKYLGVLQELGYVERQVPATARRPERGRKGRYVIVDPYLRGSQPHSPCECHAGDVGVTGGRHPTLDER